MGYFPKENIGMPLLKPEKLEADLLSLPEGSDSEVMNLLSIDKINDLYDV